MSGSWPGPKYEIRATFRAPLDYVYRWCTDYTAKDAKYEKDEYERRILSRSKNEVVYEDLSDQGKGWFWSRHVVTLSPPDHWHSDTVGSHRVYSLDYRLSSLGPTETQLVLTARRRPYGVGGKNPAKLPWERGVTQTWKNFGAALERDYRRSGSQRSRK